MLISKDKTTKNVASMLKRTNLHLLDLHMDVEIVFCNNNNYVRNDREIRPRYRALFIKANKNNNSSNNNSGALLQ